MTLYNMVNVSLPAREIVQRSWDARQQFHPSGEFMWMEPMCPWKEHVVSIEREQNQEGLIKFVFYKDGRGMVRL